MSLVTCSGGCAQIDANRPSPSRKSGEALVGKETILDRLRLIPRYRVSDILSEESGFCEGGTDPATEDGEIVRRTFHKGDMVSLRCWNVCGPAAEVRDCASTPCYRGQISVELAEPSFTK